MHNDEGRAAGIPCGRHRHSDEAGMLRVMTDTSIRGRARTVVAAIPEPTGRVSPDRPGTTAFTSTVSAILHLGLGGPRWPYRGYRRAVVNGVVEGRPRSRPANLVGLRPVGVQAVRPDLRSRSSPGTSRPPPVGWTAATIARTATVHAGQRHRATGINVWVPVREERGARRPGRCSASPATPASG